MLSARPDEVQSPYDERPCDGDCLQIMSQEVCLPSIELTAFAGSHDVRGVGDCSGPIEALPECVAHEGAWRGVVTADSSVDVPDQLLALGDGM